MALFSQRKGLTPLKKDIQIESVDTPLRNGLWTALQVCYWSDWQPEEYGHQLYAAQEIERLATRVWIRLFKKPIDTLPAFRAGPHGRGIGFLDIARNYFFEAKWFEVYDFLEFVAKNGPASSHEPFARNCNDCLEAENSAYRFVNKEIVQITEAHEISEIEEAASSGNSAVRKHIETALGLLSDRKAPDYRNSIKESISAVESLCMTLTGDRKATLGEAIKRLGLDLHPALQKGFSSLYGYTSDADGIRHGILDEPRLTFSDAKFMLVACSAFVNYLMGKKAEEK
jgi:hypothetical protein